jgi:undecaprenyl-diphosphatase
VLAVIIMAIVQGLTEFIPVSSSGHLVLFGHFLGLEQSLSAEQEKAFDLVLHGGSLVVLLVYFRRDLVALLTRTLGSHPDTPELRAMLRALVLSTVVTALVALPLQHRFESLFQAPRVVCGFLLLIGLVLLSTRFVPPPRKGVPGVVQALGIGLAQAASALLRGFSRSGSTIAAGLWLGLEPEMAARFSFLLAIPALGGAVLLSLRHLDFAAIQPSQYLVGFAVSMLASWIGLVVVMRFVLRGRIAAFGVYCIAAAAVGWILLSLGL